MNKQELNGLFCRGALDELLLVQLEKECISTVGLSLLNVFHQIVMPDRHHIRKGFAGPIGPAINEGIVVKWPVLSRQIGKDLPAL